MRFTLLDSAMRYASHPSPCRARCGPARRKSRRKGRRYNKAIRQIVEEPASRRPLSTASSRRPKNWATSPTSPALFRPRMERDGYSLGMTKDRSVIFYQIDAQGRYRSGKIMQYNPADGHRIKNSSIPVDWVEAGISERGIQAVEFALKNGRITNSDVQDMAKVSKPTATRLLTSLSDYLELKGTTGKGTYYTVKGLTKGSKFTE